MYKNLNAYHNRKEMANIQLSKEGMFDWSYFFFLIKGQRCES